MAKFPDAVGKLWITEGRDELRAFKHSGHDHRVMLLFRHIIRNVISLARSHKEIIALVSKVQQDVSQFFHCRIQQTSK